MILAQIYNKKRLINLEKSKFTLSDPLKAVLVGNILGDVYMIKLSAKANTRVVFRQGSINTEYLLYLYSLYQYFVATPPSISSITDKFIDKTRYNLSFTTLALPCFNQLYETFYVNGKKKKEYRLILLII
uniref:LAGLIDADG homing endonuclease n=1 Tax=Pappia fissilis TaxID=1040649 RepID=UPI002A83E6BE|nr:LAGLIDADG homing endonuclease [Pappia fissilis]WOX61278.1 LAGLIDADG homing endonuclease [Pappia fissilis]